MKKNYLVVFLLGLSLIVAGCQKENAKETTSSSSEIEIEKVDIKQSPDKYTFYVKNYVKRNAKDSGTLRLGGNIMESYGKANIPIVFISEDGEAVTDENRDQFIVVSQNPEPNTEIKLTYEKDENGNEKEYGTIESSLDEIELHVKRISKKESSDSSKNKSKEEKKTDKDSSEKLNGIWKWKGGDEIIELTIDDTDALLSLDGLGKTGTVEKNKIIFPAQDGEEKQEVTYKLIGETLAVTIDNETISMKK